MNKRTPADFGMNGPELGEWTDERRATEAKRRAETRQRTQESNEALVRASYRHTPGPWAVGTDTARDAAPGRVHVLAQSITTSGLETVAVAATEANARFIAAAPELLAALQALTQAVYDNRQWLSGPAYQRVVEWADNASAAIARAVQS